MATQNIEVRDHRGAPAIFVDGRPIHPQAYRIESPPLNPVYLKRFVSAGIELFFMDFNDEPDLSDREHFVRVDAQVGRLLDLAPDAYIIPSIRFHMAKAFFDAHPEALCAFEDGTRDHFMHRTPEQRYALASAVWEAEVARILKMHIEHFEAARYADNVIGYHVRCGHCGEWGFWWDSPDTRQWDLDFSPGMQAWFAGWLERKYGTDEALRQAWRDPSVTLANPRIPSAARRAQADIGAFRDPDRSRQVLDYFDASQEVIRTRARNLCGVVKRTSHHNALAGVFHGSITCGCGPAGSLRLLLESPDVDFLCSPPPYENRGPGEYSPLETAVESVKLHGKVWISEADNRTHLTKGHRAYGARNEADPPMQAMKRDFLNILTRGAHAWWYDFSREWYHDDAIQELMTRLQAIGRASLAFDRSPASDVALVYHSRSTQLTTYFVARHETFQDEIGLNRNLTHRQIIQEMGRIGMPYDTYYLEDLALTKRKYRLYYFLNVFCPDESERLAIERLKRDGNCLVFVYAAGWMHPERRPAASLDYMRELTGFAFRMEDRQESLTSRVCAAGARVLPGIGEGSALGEFRRPLTGGFELDPARPGRPAPVIKASPVFYPNPEGGIVLAEYTFNGRPSCVLREHGNWTAVTLGATSVPATIVRALAVSAGAHAYADADEIVYANRHFVGIHTSTAGRKILRLPEPSSVVDAYERRVVGDNLREIGFRMEAMKTALYFTGTPSETAKFLALIRGVKTSAERISNRHSAPTPGEGVTNGP